MSIKTGQEKVQALDEYRRKKYGNSLPVRQTLAMAVAVNAAPETFQTELTHPQFSAKKGKSLKGVVTGLGQISKRKTIVDLDLVGYSDVARSLEQIIGAIGVQILEQQIQTLVNQGLAAVNLTRTETFMQTSGDNAILAFDRAEDAHYFAKTIHTITQEQNSKRSVALALRQYRIGIATGEITMPDDNLESAYGIVITDAVRLETAANPGQILIDQATYNELPPELQNLYGSEENIQGKRSEIFKGYRYDFYSRADLHATQNHTVRKFFNWLSETLLFQQRA